MKRPLLVARASGSAADVPEEAPDLRKAFTVAALAERWSVSTDTVYAMIHSGRLKAFRFGGKLYRIRPEEVEAFETTS